MNELLSFVGDRYASPAYLRHAQYWRFLRASYLGGRAWYDQGNTAQFSVGDPASSTHHKEGTIREQAYLTRHAREPDVFYQLRFRASVYWNFMRPLVDGMAAAVARNARITELPAAIGHVLEDTGAGVDGQGKDLADFDRELGVDLIRYGMAHVFVSVPRPTFGGNGKASIDSVADERDLGMVPRARIISPIDLLRWQWDPEREEYDWAIIRERVPARLAPLIDRAPEENTEPPRYQFRYLRRDGWTLYNEAGQEIDGGPGLGFVPFVTTVREQHPLEAEPIGVSLVEDVAELDKLVYNKFSWLTEEQRNHCFNQWFLKGPDRLTPEQQVIFGSGTYIGGFEDAKILAPSVGPMEHLEDSLQHDIRRRARGILGLEAQDSDASGVKSGLAISLERAESEATLAGLAKTFETAKRRWLRMMARVAGADPDEVVVRVDRDFSELAAVGRQTQILAALKDAALPLKAKAVLQKELLVGLLPNLSASDRAALDAAIDGAVEAAEAAPALVFTPGLKVPLDGEQRDGPA